MARAGGRLYGKTAIVTGASSGIGRGIAMAFGAEGADVFVADLRSDPREGGTPTVEAIQLAGGSAVYLEVNVSVEAQVQAMVAEVVDANRRVDVLVNNAAVAGEHNKGILDTSANDWDIILGVGLRGVFLCSKYVVERMVGQEIEDGTRGRLINISSQLSVVGAPAHVAYCAAKGGVASMTRQLAIDLAPHHIPVNAIAPGYIDTAMNEGITPEELVYYTDRTPYDRLGQPSDVAAAAVYLASPECRFVTGINLPVDGGWLAA